MGRVLVTGATGFLGGHVIRALGPDVAIAQGRDPAKCDELRASGFEVLQHDLTKPIAASPKVEAIVHCAALSAAFGPRKSFVAANVDATRHVVAFAQRMKVRRFVHISSPTIYFAMADRLNLDENASLPPPINHYAATKRQAELIVQAAPDIGPLILRPRGIYGPGDKTLLPTLLKAARRPFPLLRGGAAKIDLTYVDDVVRAIQCALREDTQLDGQVFNLSGGQVLPVRDIVTQTCAAAGITARWRAVPLAPALALARLSEAAALLPKMPAPIVTRYTLGLFAYAQSLNISKACNLLQWVPKVQFANGLVATFGAEAS